MSSGTSSTASDCPGATLTLHLPISLFDLNNEMFGVMAPLTPGSLLGSDTLSSMPLFQHVLLLPVLLRVGQEENLRGRGPRRLTPARVWLQRPRRRTRQEPLVSVTGGAGLIPRATQTNSVFVLLAGLSAAPDRSHSLHPFMLAHALSAAIFETIHPALARTLSCALHHLQSRKGMHKGPSGEGGQVSL